MAIQITEKGKIIRIESPTGEFTLSMMDKIVGGWPEPNKLGPIWIIHNENAATENSYNTTASQFLQDTIHGTILIISEQELPSDWDIRTDDDEVTAEQMDKSILKAIGDSQKIDLGGDLSNNLDGDYSDEFLKKINVMQKRDEYHFRPSDAKPGAIKEESYKNFLRSAYDHVLDESSDKFKVYEDETVVITVTDDDEKIIAIDQILELFTEEEEYEKCKKLLIRKNNLGKDKNV